MNILGIVSLLDKIDVSAMKTVSMIVNLNDANVLTRKLNDISKASCSLTGYIPFLCSVQISDVCIEDENGLRKTVYSLSNKTDEESEYADLVIEKIIVCIGLRKSDGISNLISKFFSSSSSNGDNDSDNLDFINHIVKEYCPEIKILTESKYCSEATVCLQLDAKSLDLRDWRRTITRVMEHWKTMFDLNRIDATTIKNSKINVLHDDGSKKSTLNDLSRLNNECIRDIELEFSYATPVSAPVKKDGDASPQRRKRRASNDVSDIACKRFADDVK
uniref:Uncharacterized protein U9 n=1 Tax=Hyposoter didymator TaxID=260305 RepID=D7P5N3_HYPDD|nr:unknown [Hyposoter didymator]